MRAIKDDKSKPSFCANAVWYGYYPSPGANIVLYNRACRSPMTLNCSFFADPD